MGSMQAEARNLSSSKNKYSVCTFFVHRVFVFGQKNMSNNHAIMNLKYCHIRRLSIQPGRQKHLHDFRMTPFNSPQEGRPSILKEREKK